MPFGQPRREQDAPKPAFEPVLARTPQVLEELKAEAERIERERLARNEGGTSDE